MRKYLLCLCAVLLMAAPARAGSTHLIGSGVASGGGETITIGSEASDRPAYTGGNETDIDGNATASGTGTITQIKMFVHAVGDDNWKVGIFYRPDAGGAPNNFTCRDATGNLDVDTGLNTFNAPGDFTALSVVEGDFIGVFFNGGSIDATGSAGTNWWLAGDQTACEDTEFSAYTSVLSLYGEGSE